MTLNKKKQDAKYVILIVQNLSICLSVCLSIRSNRLLHW